MKLVNWTHSPNIGPFVPYSFHQHYSKGLRHYDYWSVPSVSYSPPSKCDMQREKGPFVTLYDAQCSLPPRKRLGKHGQRGVEVLVPDDFPYESWMNSDAKATWASISKNSPYNDDTPRLNAAWREPMPHSEITDWSHFDLTGWEYIWSR